MKKISGLCALMLALILSACKPVTFTEPQPKDVAALDAFPARLHGKYLNSSDSSLLQITSLSMILSYQYDEKIHVSQLDTTEQLIGDTLFDMLTAKGELIRIEGDSIVKHISGSDTLFAIDAQHVLKKLKGHYFLNTSDSPDNWQVQKLELAKGKLTLSSLNAKEDLDQLVEITEYPQDTTAFVFSPSRKQFKEFVRKQGFRQKEEFWKVSK